MFAKSRSQLRDGFRNTTDIRRLKRGKMFTATLMTMFQSWIFSVLQLTAVAERPKKSFDGYPAEQLFDSSICTCFGAEFWMARPGLHIVDYSPGTNG